MSAVVFMLSLCCCFSSVPEPRELVRREGLCVWASAAVSAYWGTIRCPRETLLPADGDSSLQSAPELVHWQDGECSGNLTGETLLTCTEHVLHKHTPLLYLLRLVFRGEQHDDQTKVSLSWSWIKSSCRTTRLSGVGLTKLRSRKSHLHHALYCFAFWLNRKWHRGHF